MGKFWKTMGYGVLSAFNRIVPKQNKIVFYGGDRLYDNTEAVFAYLEQNTDYRIVCIANQNLNFKAARTNVKFCRNSSARVIFELLSCKVCIDSFLHGVKIKPTKKQFFLQLWHGSPLKSGKSFEVGKYYSKVCYAAPKFKEIYQKQFGVPSEKMFLNGNPRNDYLFSPDSSELSNAAQIKKRVIWMPTFRQGLGSNEGGDILPTLSCENVDELNTFLAERGIVLYIKPHPHQRGGISEIVGEKSHIVVIDDALLREKNIQLYRFLGNMDALLTDYSSVFYDYLLLDRPIGFVIADINEYGAGRGFSFENPLDYMPGEKILSLDALKQFFEDLLENKDPFAEERRRICDMANYYKDNRNCERILCLIREQIGHEQK